MNWNYYKPMLATIHTMFVNKKIKRIYSFCPYSTWNTRQMHFKRSIVTKTVPPAWPPKIPHRGGRRGGCIRGREDVVLRRQNKIIVVSLECNLNPILTIGIVPDISKTIINTFRSNL